MKNTRLIFFVTIFIFSYLQAQNKIEAYINDPDGYTNIRKKPSIKSQIIGRIIEAELFICFPDSHSNWWRVITDKNLKGYVHKSRIKTLNNITEEIKNFFNNFKNIDPNNAEYGEIYNEKLFEYLQKFPFSFINAFLESDKKTQYFILNELESPIHDQIDLKKIYDHVNNSKGDTKTKNLILNSLKIALDNMG